MRFCTAATSTQLPETRELADALARLHPGAPRLEALVIGPHPAEEPFDVLEPASLELPGWSEIVQDASLDELVERVLPLLLRHLLRRHDEPIVLLGPTVEVLAPLTALEDALGRAAIAIVPRVAEGLPADGLIPGATEIGYWGQYDPACVALRPGSDALAILGWWEERAAAGDAAGFTLGNIQAAFTDLVAVIDDRGIGVSGWNLHARPLTRDEDGTLLAAGRPLSTFNFEGFRADRPYWLRDDFTRVRVLDDQLLAELCAGRGRRLLERGWLPPRALEHTRQRLTNGIPYNERLKRLHARALASGVDIPDLSTDEGTAALMAYARGKVNELVADGVSRYLHDVYLARPDLHAAFPDLAGDDGERFLRWAWEWGIDELGLTPELLEPLPGSDGATRAAGVATANGATPPAPRNLSVEALGYFDGNLGLGQAARGYTEALRAAGVPVATRNVTAMIPSVPGRELTERAPEREFERGDDVADAAVSLICLNADQLITFIREEGPVIPAERFRIGLWAWETDAVPDRWKDAYQHVDEIWTYSRYTADILAAVSPVPVVAMPLPVAPPDPAGEPAPDGLPDGFLFLLTLDLFSTIERKNPLGVIEAFKGAFAPGEGPRLVIKTINADKRPRQLDALRHAIGDRDDIVVFDAALSPAEQAALLARADCFVSLHRAEGWGLGLAESMALGKPCVATRYSGNLDFMTEENSYLVRCSVTTVGAETEIYPADGHWAEPDLEHAAEQMRRVYDDPEHAAAVGARGQADVLDELSPARIGRQLRDRLEVVVPLKQARVAAGCRGGRGRGRRRSAVGPRRPGRRPAAPDGRRRPRRRGARAAHDRPRPPRAPGRARPRPRRRCGGPAQAGRRRAWRGAPRPLGLGPARAAPARDRGGPAPRARRAPGGHAGQPARAPGGANAAVGRQPRRAVPGGRRGRGARRAGRRPSDRLRPPAGGRRRGRGLRGLRGRLPRRRRARPRAAAGLPGAARCRRRPGPRAGLRARRARRAPARRGPGGRGHRS